MSIIKPYRWLSKEKIEATAHKLLQDMDGTSNAPKWLEVADCATNFLGLNIVWESIPVEGSTPVFARIYPLQKLIELNENLSMLQENFGLEQSTKGHEIGHWMLHINQDKATGFTKQTELALDELNEAHPFLCRSVNDSDNVLRVRLTKQQESIEWQAQYFSSCLLMPKQKLLEEKKGRNLTNYRHLCAIAEDLGVSISNLTHRLKDLEWIRTASGSKQLYIGQHAPSDDK